MSLYYSATACILSFLFLPKEASANNIIDLNNLDRDTLTNPGNMSSGSVLQPETLSGGGGSGFSNSPASSLSGLDFSGDSFSGVVRELFRISVVLTIVLAVIMLTVGGIQYMGSESMFQKDAGRKRMMAAIGGLLIAVLSIFILNIIIGTGTGGGELDVGDSFN